MGKVFKIQTSFGMSIPSPPIPVYCFEFVSAEIVFFFTLIYEQLIADDLRTSNPVWNLFDLLQVKPTDIIRPNHSQSLSVSAFVCILLVRV